MGNQMPGRACTLVFSQFIDGRRFNQDKEKKQASHNIEFYVLHRIAYIQRPTKEIHSVVVKSKIADYRGHLYGKVTYRANYISV